MRILCLSIIILFLFTERSFSQIKRNSTYYLNNAEFYQITFYENGKFERLQFSNNDVGIVIQGTFEIINNILKLKSLDLVGKNIKTSYLEDLLSEEYKIIKSDNQSLILKPKFGRNKSRLKFYLR